MDWTPSLQDPRCQDHGKISSDHCYHVCIALFSLFLLGLIQNSLESGALYPLSLAAVMIANYTFHDSRDNVATSPELQLPAVLAYHLVVSSSLSPHSFVPCINNMS